MKADVIMPNSPQVFSEGPNSQGDERALQIALELSNLGLLGGSGDDDGSTSSYDESSKNKKSQNMTECVPVPSSEHVAEIVGRQGCKIKALRAKTNTYIKTPVRGEEPVFVVTGRKEDVAMARREVQSAAEHFTQIRASRNRHAALMNGQAVNDANSATITLQVRVPYRVVGLVVGPKGATIKRIQQQTHTYIVTPSRDKEPVFEVTGLPENVEKAKEEIEAHIAARTGTQQVSVDDDFRNNGTEVGPAIGNKPQNIDDIFKQNIIPTNPQIPSTTMSTFNPYNNNNNTTSNSILRTQAPSFNPPSLNHKFTPVQHNTTNDPIFGGNIIPGFPFQDIPDNSLYGSAPPIPNPQAWSSGSDSTNTNLSYPSMRSGSTGSNGFSPTSSFGSGGVGSHPRLSPTFSDPEFPIGQFFSAPVSGHQAVRRVGSDSVDSACSFDYQMTNAQQAHFTTTPALNIESGYSSGGTSDSLTSGSPIESGTILAGYDGINPTPQKCAICKESSVVAALVPCGHNHFCYNCANSVANRPQALCPFCNKPASMALLIKK